MQSHTLIGWLVIGIIAGALAGRLVEGRGFGCLLNLVVGIAGAVIGGALLGALAPNVTDEGLVSLIVAFVGATILLALLRLLSGGRPLGGGRAGPYVR